MPRTSASRAPTLALLVGLGACAHAVAPVPPLPVGPVKNDGVRRAETVASFPADELSPSASRDRRHVAFVSDENGSPDIWVKNLVTGDTFVLAADPSDDVDPAFAPDSRRVAFVSRRIDAKGDLFLTALDGGDAPERLTDERTQDRQPVFTPDGRALFFTQAHPIGLEYVARLDLGDRRTAIVSPTPGFDPAVSPDGRYLVYTAAAGTEGRRHNALILLRLADSATRALTRGDDPAGFARFHPTRTASITIDFVRFADDDDGDGRIDGGDQASLWRLSVAPERLFDAPAGPLPEPWPLTAGNKDELFPEPAEGVLYFAETARLDQDVVRLPLEGMFPESADPAEYLELAKGLSDRRERWFALRAAVARSRPGELVRAQALLSIANLHLESGHARFAGPAFDALIESARGAAPEGRLAELGGIGEVERESLARLAIDGRDASRRDRELTRLERRLASLIERFGWSERVVARAELELAEIVADRGDRAGAIAGLEQVIARHSSVSYSVARAMLRRAELLGVAFDPDALGEAYQAVLDRYPEAEPWAARAAEGLVAAHVEAALALDPGGEVDAIRRLVERSRAYVVRAAGRRRLATVLEANGHVELALAELEALAAEAELAGDRAGAAAALFRVAEGREQAGDDEGALGAYLDLRRQFGDVPGTGSRAQGAITQVALRKAKREEQAGDLAAAYASYEKVLENDFSQVRAHRRLAALAAELGRAEALLAAAALRVAQSPRSPIVRYAHALALVWQAPPELGRAFEEVGVALAQNPQFAAGYLLRGWIHEMRELEDPRGDALELAIEDYEKADRLQIGDPATRADIALNAGNAKWRLAAKTFDGTNFSEAFSHYMARLLSGVPFERPETELVFHERLGRAALWNREYAISTMATREAIRLAEAGGHLERLGQLYGNLAVAYTQAGEDALAAEAFRRFATELEAADLESRTAIARRNRALATLRAAARTGAQDVVPALEDLALARADLREREVDLGVELNLFERLLGLFGVKVPLTVDAEKNASRAPFGFRRSEEVALNLSLAAWGHRLLGEPARAAEVEARHLAAVREALDRGAPKLPEIEEWLGLEVRALRASARAGDSAAVARFLGLMAELARLAEAEGLEGAADALALDRARLLAVTVEESARLVAERGPRGVEWNHLEAELEHASADLEQRLAKAGTALPPPAGAGSTWTATTAPAMAPAGTPGAPFLAMRARIAHARGLVRLARALEPGAADDLGAVLGDLDRAVDQLELAGREFAAAARLGHAAELPLGRRLEVGGWVGVEAAAARLGLPSAAIDAAARRAGELGVLGAEWARVLAAAERDPSKLGPTLAALAEALPAELLAEAPRVERLLVRSASVALAAGDPRQAFDVVDRLLLFRRAVKGHAGVRPLNRPEAEWLAALDAHLAERKSAADDLLASSRERDLAAEIVARKARLAETTAALAKLKARAPDGLRSRVYAEPIGLDLLESELAPGEALLVPVVLGERLTLFWVDGSTVAEPKLLVRESPGRPGEARLLVAAVAAHARAGLLEASGAPLRLEELLLSPFADRLARTHTVILADADLGGPISLWRATAASRVAFAHVTAPSALVASRVAATWMVGERVGIGAEPPAERAIEPSALASARDADDETLRLIGFAPRDALLVGPPVTLEPESPGRSTVDLMGAAEVADRFRGERPLRSLAAPSRILVFRHADPPPGLAPPSPLGLELDLTAVGSLLALPPGLAAPARQAFVRDFFARLGDASPAQALRAAVRAALPTEPRLAGAALLGSPGFAREDGLAHARSRLAEVRAQSNAAFVARRYGLAAALFGRRFGLEVTLDEVEKLERTCEAWNRALAEVKRFREAVEAERRCLAELEKKKKAPAVIGAAKIRLGVSLGASGDAAGAEAALREAAETFAAADDASGSAQAWVAIGDHLRATRDFERAAASYERAVVELERIGAFAKRPVGREALRVLTILGSVYLNSLSDLGRARGIYERLLGYAATPEERVKAHIDLVRVARRGGDFSSALEGARAAGQSARAIARSDLELQSLVEAANVAWYQGDYARGLELCRDGQELAAKNLAAERKRQPAKMPKEPYKALIYVLSVCGVLHMSTHDAESAERVLERARRLALAIDDPPEVANQWNNLGVLYREVGRLDEAIAAFDAARRIDERRNDQYGLAYDLRNLGIALHQKQKLDDADAALQRALALSEEVKDANNELRVRFALGEVKAARGDERAAKESFERALALAERQKVSDLAAQTLRALAGFARRAGDAPGAEALLRRAIGVTRTITGRASGGDRGPDRYGAWDDRVFDLLRADRALEALHVAEDARVHAESAFIDDRRVAWADPATAADLEALRRTATPTAAAPIFARLQAAEPHLARLLAPPALADRSRWPADAAVVTYRATAAGLVAFAVDRERVVFAETTTPRAALRERVRALAAGLAAHGDVSALLAELGAELYTPLASALEGKRRLVLVLPGLLRYVPFAALPHPRGALVDAFVLEQAPSLAVAAELLAAPGRGALPPLVAIGTRTPGGTSKPLWLADKELAALAESFPRAELIPDGSRRALLEAMARPGVALHFAGHVELDRRDPLLGRLETGDRPIRLFELAGRRFGAELVVLSSCSAAVGGHELWSGEEHSSLADVLVMGGVGAVVASSSPVLDVSAAFFMKRLYRSLGSGSFAEALRATQLAVRRYEPHPAWWATFSVLRAR